MQYIKINQKIYIFILKKNLNIQGLTVLQVFQKFLEVILEKWFEQIVKQSKNIYFSWCRAEY